MFINTINVFTVFLYIYKAVQRQITVIKKLFKSFRKGRTN